MAIPQSKICGDAFSVLCFGYTTVCVSCDVDVITMRLTHWQQHKRNSSTEFLQKFVTCELCNFVGTTESSVVDLSGWLWEQNSFAFFTAVCLYLTGYVTVVCNLRIVTGTEISTLWFWWCLYSNIFTAGCWSECSDDWYLCSAGQ